MTMLRGTPVQYEFKLTNRFEVQFPQELDMGTWTVQSTGRPNLNVEKVKVGYMNGYNYTTSKYEWEPITIKFIDLIGPSTSQKLMEWARLHAESFTGRMGYAAGYKKTLTLTILDPTGVAIEKWTLYNCQIEKVEFPEMSYDEGNVVMPTLTLQPEFCEQDF